MHRISRTALMALFYAGVVARSAMADPQADFDRGIQANQLAQYAEAVKWYRKAAEQGHAAAQWELGFMYDVGIGVVKNSKSAVKWYRMAAEQGDENGQLQLGVMYLNGHGVVMNDKIGMRWIRKAAEQGLADAQAMLGVMYKSGRGVEKDNIEAYKWILLALAQDDLRAKANLSRVERGLTPKQIQAGQDAATAWQEAFEKRQAQK